MADNDLVLNVKQIAQYPRATAVKPTDVFLIQQDSMGAGPLGGPYASVDGPTILRTVLANGGWLQLAPGAGGIAFNGAAFSFASGSFQLTEDVHVPSLHSDGDIFVNGIALADQEWVSGLFDTLLENSVWSFNGRKGEVQLERDDVLRAGAAPIWDAHFGGHITAPTPWNVYANDDTVATVKWVQQWACSSGLVVSSYNGRGGAITPIADDVTTALGVPGTYALANTPPLGDASRKIATTLFVDNAIEDVRVWTTNTFETYTQILALQYAPLNSPNFIGVPTAPTANPGTSTGQLATTAFVQAAVAASTTGVSSFNGRTGAVVLDTADLVTAGAATLNSPAFTGTPTAPTAAPGSNTTQLATCAFVEAAVAAVNAGVLSFNGRAGAVTLLLADVTGVGGAPIASPNFSGTPTAPTAAPNTASTQLATCAFVTAAIAALPSPVTSFNGRTGAISLIGADVSAAGGALTASPAFTGVPTAPTAIAGTATTQLATTAFVQAAVTGATAGVSTWNGRSGAVTLQLTDVTGVGGAPLASPTFTGIPAAPTPAPGTNSTQLATTAFVTAAIAAATGVSSFNTRTGAITLNSGDVSAAGGALIASPTFTGTPAAPTAVPGTNTTQLATTQFVMTALSTAGGVSSFNGRAGAITLTTADITGAGGAPLASPALTGTPTVPTATAGTNTTQVASTAFVETAVGAAQAPQPGARVLLMSSVVPPGTPVASVMLAYAFDSTYDEFEIHIYNAQPTGSGDINLQMRFSFDGTTVDSSTAYVYGTMYGNSNASGAGSGGITNFAFIANVQNIAAVQGGSHSYLETRVRLPLPWATWAAKQWRAIAMSSSSAGIYCTDFAGMFQQGSANYLLPIKGLQFAFASGNIARGTFLLYGIVRGSGVPAAS